MTDFTKQQEVKISCLTLGVGHGNVDGTEYGNGNILTVVPTKKQEGKAGREPQKLSIERDVAEQLAASGALPCVVTFTMSTKGKNAMNHAIAAQIEPNTAFEPILQSFYKGELKHISTGQSVNSSPDKK